MKDRGNPVRTFSPVIQRPPKKKIFPSVEQGSSGDPLAIIKRRTLQQNRINNYETSKTTGDDANDDLHSTWDECIKTDALEK